MQSINNISIILSFLGLWISSFFSGDSEISLGFFLIFTFGILHGSNDLLLITVLQSKKPERPFLKLLMAYLLIVLLGILIFYLAPIIALILFMIFSSFHFGEQHWEHQNINVNEFLSGSFYCLYGLFVLLLLFAFNSKDVIDIVFLISNYSITEELILNGFLTIATIFAALTTYLAVISKKLRNLIFKELFYLLLFAIIFKVSTLIWGFTIYFIFWHSLPSLFEQITFIYGDYNKRIFFSYCLRAFPYWLVSLLGILIIYYLFNDQKLFYAIFFSFIAAVTFPHSIIINRMFKEKKTQSN